MNKILLIIQREYVTRVRKKSFIVMIFVVPCLILAMGFAIYMVGKNSTELGNKEIVKVLDESGQFEGKFKNQRNLEFQYTKQSYAEVKAELLKDENLSALQIPADYTKNDAVKISSKKKPGITIIEKIEAEMNDIATKTAW